MQSAQETRARQIVASRSTESLCEMFEALNAVNHDRFKEQALVRGWIMDELERRDSAAFEAWMDCDDPAFVMLPGAFFLNAPRGFRFGTAPLHA